MTFARHPDTLITHMVKHRDAKANSSAATPRKAARSRDLIIDATIEALNERPMREVTIEEVMRRTALSRPAFYQYFRSVPAVIKVLLDRLQTEMMSSGSSWLSTDGDRLVCLRESLSGLMSVVRAHGPLFRAITEAAPLDTELEASWRDFMVRWDGAVAARIVAEQQRGLIDRSIDAHRIARALNLMDQIVMVDFFGGPEQADLESAVDVIFRIWSATLYGTVASPDRS